MDDSALGGCHHFLSKCLRQFQRWVEYSSIVYTKKLGTPWLGPHFLSQVRVRKKPIFTAAAAKPHLRVEKNEAIFLIMKLGEKLVASIIAWISWSYYFVSKVNRYFVHSKKNILSSPIYYLFIFCCFFLTLSFSISSLVFFWNSSSPKVFWISRWFLSLCTYLLTKENDLIAADLNKYS